MTENSTRAKVFANAFSALSRDNCLHIYDDGYVVAVACSTDRHLEIRKLLRTHYPDVVTEEARSDDGFLSVFVLPGITPPRPPAGFGPVALLTDYFRDHRFEDDHLIDDAARLLS